MRQSLSFEWFFKPAFYVSYSVSVFLGQCIGASESLSFEWFFKPAFYVSYSVSVFLGQCIGVSKSLSFEWFFKPAFYVSYSVSVFLGQCIGASESLVLIGSSSQLLMSVISVSLFPWVSVSVPVSMDWSF